MTEEEWKVAEQKLASDLVDHYYKVEQENQRLVEENARLQADNKQLRKRLEGWGDREYDCSS